MDFLERFNERERDRLLSVAQTVRLGRGEILIRRGEKGGDIYRVAEGELEVIDTRSQPVVVLDVLQRGAVVGEMAFLDESVRSADVRSVDLGVCQRWDRAALIRLLQSDPGLGASFFQVLARLVSERARSVSNNAIAGAFSSRRGAAHGSAASSAFGRTLAQQLTNRLIAIEPVIRKDRELAHREVVTALQNFKGAFHEALVRMSDDDQASAGAEVSRELHPYVMRSHIGELCLDRPSGHAADVQVLAHLDANKVEGDGPLGEFIDGWLLELPTSRSMRERRALASQAVLEALPSQGLVRMLLVNVGSGAVLGHISPYLARMRGEIVCVDSERDNLAAIDARLRKRPPDLKLRLLQEDLASVCLGQARVRHPPQQIIVLDGLVDYLPERVCASLLRWAAGQLAPNGTLIATAVTPAADDAVFRYLLAWPMVRRSRSVVESLFASAGLNEISSWEAGGAGLVVRGRAPAAESTFPLPGDLETDPGAA